MVRALDEEEVDTTSTATTTPWSSVWVTAAVSAAQALVCYAFFLWKRRRDAAQKELDLYEPRQHTRAHRSPDPFAECWWKEAWQYPDARLLHAVGLDMFQFLRVLWLGVRLCSVGTLLSCVLIPIYATGSNQEAQEFNQLTLARVDDTWPLYIAVACWYIFSSCALYMLWQEWFLFRTNRSIFLAKGDPDMPKAARYAAVVEQASEEQMLNLAQYLDGLFPGAVLAVSPCLKTKDLEKLMAKREKIILILESVLATETALPKKAPVMVKVKGVKVEARTHYENEIEWLNEVIDQLRCEIKQITNTPTSSQKSKPLLPEVVSETENESIPRNRTAVDDSMEVNASDLLNTIAISETMESDDKQAIASDKSRTSNSSTRISSTAFVTFNSLKAKQAAVQCEIAGDPDAIFLRSATNPVSIVWSNITVRIALQTWCQLACGIFWCVGILFWAVPVAFVTSIANLNGILEALNLEPVDTSTAWYGLVSGLLPVIFLAILMAVLYMAIRFAAVHVIRFKSWPQVDAYTLYWHQLFQFANLWLILIGGSLFNQLESILDADFGEVAQIVAEAMPGASAFFVNMMLVTALGGMGMELSRIPVYAVKRILGCIQAAPTQRQLEEARKPQAIEWGQAMPPIVFIFLVVFMYMAIVPLMTAIGLLYFTGMYLVWKHQCLHVYAVEFEGGGDATWSRVFGFLMTCLYMGEVVFIAYMGLKEAPVPAGLGFVPLIITFFVHRALKRKVIEPLRNLSLELASDIDRQDGVLEQPENGEDLYLQPSMNAAAEERGPIPYHPEEAELGIGKTQRV